MVKHEVGKPLGGAGGRLGWGGSITVLGGYHIFMMPAKSGFHKTIYKRVWFSLFSPPKIYMLGKGINIYILKKPILNMLVFKIMRTTSSPLRVLPNWVLLINWLLLKNIREN
jgi:hypothetical protein